MTSGEGFMWEGRGSRGYKRHDPSLRWDILDQEVSMEDENLKRNEATVNTGGITEARNGPVHLLRES